jgi:hypothetical protein
MRLALADSAVIFVKDRTDTFWPHNYIQFVKFKDLNLFLLDRNKGEIWLVFKISNTFLLKEISRKIMSSDI